MLAMAAIIRTRLPAEAEQGPQVPADRPDVLPGSGDRAGEDEPVEVGFGRHLNEPRSYAGRGTYSGEPGVEVLRLSRPAGQYAGVGPGVLPVTAHVIFGMQGPQAGHQPSGNSGTGRITRQAVPRHGQDRRGDRRPGGLQLRSLPDQET